MRYQVALLAALAAQLVSAQNDASGPDTSPPGTPYPDTTFPYAVSNDPAVVAGSKAFEKSLPYYPSPWAAPTGNWTAAYEKATAFVKQLTLTEKVNLTTGVGWEGYRCVGNSGSVPRLGFRSLCWMDSPVGIRDTDFNSVFSSGVNVAATWSRDMAYSRGADMGAEHRDKGSDMQLGPVAGPLGRAPEGGRNWEGFSPDPYLTGQLFATSVQGIQSSGVIACAKHYLLYEQEHFRQAPQAPFNITDSYSSNVDDTTIHETYLWPFADAVRAGVGSVMCSYNQANNSYACGNSYLTNHLLKSELGFNGFLISDWSGTHSGVGSVLAGLDFTAPGDVGFDTSTSYFGANLTIGVLNGTIPQWRLDDMVTRLMTAYYYVGRDKYQVPINFDAWTTNTFGPENYYAGMNNGLINEHVDVRGDHAQGIRELGAASVVLLKNTNDALPLTGKEKLTGIFGEDAGDNRYGPNGCSDRGCDNGTLAVGWGSGTANFASLVTPEFAIMNELLTQGSAVESITDNYAYNPSAAQIPTLAGRASAALVFINSDSGEGYINVDGNVGDRKNTSAWIDGENLVKNVSSLCNNTIVIVHSVGAIDMESFKNNPNVTGLLWAGLPGDQSGWSIADVLYGRVNPGGKLPFTIANKRSDYGTDVLYVPPKGQEVPQIQFQEGNFIDYRNFDKHNITPTYEFGYGISYTNFSYSNLQVQKHSVAAYKPNTGKTKAAPTFGTVSNNSADYVFPSGLERIPAYIYPYINSTNLKASSGDPDYGKPGSVPANAQNGNPQTVNPAGGAPGGNPQLWDVMYTVSCSVHNSGQVKGDEVVQMYVSLGGQYDPKIVLRGFDRLTNIEPGQTATFSADITRRDLSNWDTTTQNWVVKSSPKTVYVGASSRNLPLSAKLQ